VNGAEAPPKIELSPLTVEEAARRLSIGRTTQRTLRADAATAAYRSGAPVSTLAAHSRWSAGSPVVPSYVRAVDR
jgi:hypothetical protein